jgi:hypothetical protein
MYKIKASNPFELVRFCALYSITIYLTWLEDDLFTNCFYAIVTDEPCNKITSEEKARLISENLRVINKEPLNK